MMVKHKCAICFATESPFGWASPVVCGSCSASLPEMAAKATNLYEAANGLRHSSHQNPPTPPDAHAGHPANSSTAQTLVRIADALEGLLELGHLWRAGGAACGGREGEARKPLGACSDLSASPEIYQAGARCVVISSTCEKVSREIDRHDQIMTIEATPKKQAKKKGAVPRVACRFPDIDAPLEELLSFLAKWEIDQKDPDYKRFSLFYQANGRTMKNWKAAWRSWRERELQFQRNSTRPNQPVSQSMEYKLAWMKDKK